jgi:YggT family protein
MAAILFILDALLTLVVVAFLLRAVMPLVRADFRNPLGQAVLRFTDPLVRPLRRVLGPVGRVDVASFVALLLVQFAGAALLRLVAGGGFGLGGTVVAGLSGLAQTILRFYSVAILAYAVLSWVMPGSHSPATRLLAALCEPLLGPVRRVLPSVAGLDLAPLIVLIGLQALQILLR